MATSLDGRPPDDQRASQPMHEGGQGSRRPIANTDEDAPNCRSASAQGPDSLCSSRRTVWQRNQVGFARDQQTRGSSTPADLAS